ncbi:rhomboid-like protein [Dactylosporangium sp. AC04546]|uniref:rhomboid-like protein n=1 Tax=Dactylosporangium sp. AC04546 TaxID=2862460 RepID=UPI001EDD85C6|nr:rhomboid-like protein [Dactylosporangium sp. AC04546]WVK82350.1 rhomboid-like protein [Dactylosporangium sp. AC04546]
MYKDLPGLAPASYLPGGDLADEVRAAPGWTAKTKTWLLFLSRVRIAPLYVLIVVVINVVLNHAVSAETRSDFVLANSTNVNNLEHHRIWTLVTSAFVLDERAGVGAVLPLLALLSVAEVLWGWRRLLLVFFLSNAVASCLVYGLLLIGVRGNWLGGAVTMANDVGTSYGSHAVGGALALTLPVRARRLLVPLAVIAVVVPLLNGASFTDIGHLLAVLLGFVAGWQMRRRPLAWCRLRPASRCPDRTVAYSFDDVTQARAALLTALRLHGHRQARLDDAVAACSDRAARIHVRETRDMAAIDGALAGGAGGVLLGTFIGIPLIGLFIGAVVVAAVARRHDAGLKDTTVERTMCALPAGRGALLLLADPAGEPALTRELARTGGTPVPEAAREQDAARPDRDATSPS